MIDSFAILMILEMKQVDFLLALGGGGGDFAIFHLHKSKLPTWSCLSKIKDRAVEFPMACVVAIEKCSINVLS